MTKSVSIRVIGSINLDIVASGAALPGPGETVTGATLAYHPGGKGANQALAASRLGAQVTLIGCVGTDAAADQALALLRANGVDVSGVQAITGMPTGVALIAVDPAGENQIVVAAGANEAVTPLSLMPPPLMPPPLAPFEARSFDATICQLELPIATIEAIASGVDGFWAINLAPAQKVSRGILKRADLIIVNQTEAAFYGDQLNNLPGLLVVTLGKEGAKMYQGGSDPITATPPLVTPIDTTGAGDTFVGALVVALMEGQSRSDALTFACAAGASATQIRGAQPSMPDRAAVMALMSQTV